MAEVSHMMDRRAFGEYGERIACRYLRKNGYKIIGSRWSTRRGEIDLIARHGGEVVFVEVKARRSSGFGSPVSAVDARKRQRLRVAAWEYLMQHGMENEPYRIDVIAVWYDMEDRIRLSHITSAVQAED